jgi:hypothetical protein
MMLGSTTSVDRELRQWMVVLGYLMEGETQGNPRKYKHLYFYPNSAHSIGRQVLAYTDLSACLQTSCQDL